MSFIVAEFVGEKDVAIISSKWLIGDKHAMWPTARPAQFRRLLKSHSRPEDGHFDVYEIRILKKTSKQKII